MRLWLSPDGSAEDLPLGSNKIESRTSTRLVYRWVSSLVAPTNVVHRRPADESMALYYRRVQSSILSLVTPANRPEQARFGQTVSLLRTNT